MTEGGTAPASGGTADLEHVAAEDDVAGMDALHALVLEDLCDDVLGPAPVDYRACPPVITPSAS